MKDYLPSYPDNSGILARKAEGRRKLAAISFGEKLAILDLMKERVEPIRRAREIRRQQQRQVVSERA